MSWNFRVVKTNYIFEGKTNPVFTIHRCVYASLPVVGNELPTKFGIQEAAPEGESVEELRAELHRMLEALDRPVLTEKRGKLVEVK